jgi:hypothetical protein
MVLMGLRLGSPLVCSINMRVGQEALYTPTRHHVKTIAATSSHPNLKTLVMCEVLAHPRTVFHPCTCGLRGGAAAVAAMLIDYSGQRSLLGQGCGGGDRDRLLPLYQQTIMLDHCSNCSFIALRV